MKRAWRDAVERGDAAALRALLEAGGDPDARDRYGQTGLLIAARLGHLDAVRALVDAGADLDHTAKFRLSALMLAIVNGHDGVARLLVEAGADLSITGSGAPGFDGKRAVDLARDRGSASIAELLGSKT
jgi:hypothetical protein